MSEIIEKKIFFDNDIPNFKNNINIIDDDLSFGLESTFTSFRTLSNILILIYTNMDNYLIFYDLEKNCMLKKMDSNHNENVSIICHFNNFEKKTDIIATISPADFNTGIWDVSSFKLISNLTCIYTNGYIASSCFIYFNYKIFLGFVNNNINEKIKLINRVNIMLLSHLEWLFVFAFSFN